MMESVLSNSSKVMVDVEGGNNLLYLPLDKLMDRQGSGGETRQQKASADILKDIRQRGVKSNQRARTDALRSRGVR
jgi:membrane protease subunit HflK